MLAGVRTDLNELKNQTDRMSLLLQELLPEGNEDNELTLPGGLRLPLGSQDDIAAMETALEDGEFRKRLVCSMFPINFVVLNVAILAYFYVLGLSSGRALGQLIKLFQNPLIEGTV